MTTIQEPRVVVLIERPDGDYDEVTVQTDNRDRVRFDIMRSRKGWPQPGDAPSLWMTVMAWNALRRSGHDVGKDPDTWIDTVAGVYSIDENGEVIKPGSGKSGVDVDPTQPGVDSDS